MQNKNNHKILMDFISLKIHTMRNVNLWLRLFMLTISYIQPFLYCTNIICTRALGKGEFMVIIRDMFC